MTTLDLPNSGTVLVTINNKYLTLNTVHDRLGVQVKFRRSYHERTF